MFSAMGNCVSCIKRKRQPRRKITLAILGVDNAGKSTIVKGLLGEPLETSPTIGFCTEDIQLGSYDLTIFDLGGGKNIRDIWSQYLSDLYGVIYVVDSADVDRLEEIKDNLQVLLGQKMMKGKPLLLLANKQDLSNAMDEVDICEQLSLENTVNFNKCPCRIEICSAIKGTGRKLDPNIKHGIKWLCGIIEHNWDKYNDRVDKDMKEEAERRKIEAAAKKERVRKMREERERKEKEEKERLGIKDEDEEEDEADFMNGGPFKKLNVKDLEKRELKEKEEKKRRKMLEEQKRLGDDEDAKDDDDNDVLGRRSHLTSERLGLNNGGFMSENACNNAESDDDDLLRRRVHKLTPRLPPLQKPLGTRIQDETADGVVKKLRRKKKKPKLKPVNEFADEGSEENDDTYENKKSLRSVSNVEFCGDSHLDINGHGHSDNKWNSLNDTNNDEITPRTKKKRSKKKKKKANEGHLEDGYGMDLTTPRSLTLGHREEMDNVYNAHTKTDLQNDDSDVEMNMKKSKVKKSYIKKNKTAPSDDESEVQRYPVNKDFTWTMSPRREMDEKIRNNRQGEDDNTEMITVSSSKNWQLAEDLDLDEDSALQSTRQRISNLDDDDDIVY